MLNWVFFESPVDSENVSLFDITIDKTLHHNDSNLFGDKINEKTYQQHIAMKMV